MTQKNSPRLGGLLLDVIPRQFERIQPSDNRIISKKLKENNTFSEKNTKSILNTSVLSTIIAYALNKVNARLDV